MDDDDGRYAIPELLVQRLVVPHLHAGPSPQTATDGSQQQQGGFGNAPFAMPGFPLVKAVGHKSDDSGSGERQKKDITYILSKDILRHRRSDKQDADVWLAKGGSWQDDVLKVWATGSNDSGVSWVLETAGRRIFHAGDLNNWYARFLAEGIANQSIYNKETDEDIDPLTEEKRYLGELKDIKKIADAFDIVMFPIDGRIGDGYTLGGRQFIERFKVRLFVPMHFVASGFESAWRFREFAEAKGIDFWAITHEGETMEF